MANQKHLVEFKRGVESWNKWRESNPDIRPDLSRIKINRENFSGANLRRASFRRARLWDVDFSKASFEEADLRKADLSGSNLHEGILFKTNLQGADLSWANLSAAKLREANLRETVLEGVDLLAADLTGVDFANSIILSSTFADVDLRSVKGLDTVSHGAPSTIGIDTIYRSEGKIPEHFLRGAGVPENFITFMHSLVGKPFDYYSCFISHSSKDQDFAKLLHAGLQQEGVRCWYAPEDLKTGDKFRQRIDEAIHIYDKLLVVLSENSIQSAWVEEEVEGALEKERRENKLALFPIRLDDAVMETKQAWAASLRRLRHIADFTKWKDHDFYQNAFKRLLRDLQGKDAAKAGIERTP